MRGSTGCQHGQRARTRHGSGERKRERWGLEEEEEEVVVVASDSSHRSHTLTCDTVAASSGVDAAPSTYGRRRAYRSNIPQ